VDVKDGLEMKESQHFFFAWSIFLQILKILLKKELTKNSLSG